LAPTHLPVMVNEVVQGLAVRPGGRYVDCTLGGGGHSAAILEHSLPGGQLMGLDADPEAISIARHNLYDYRDSIRLVNDNFVNLRSVCDEYSYYPVNGILFDLGLSSFQLASDVKGFSFQRESLLDMRFSPEQEITAEDIVNTFSEDELADLLYRYGEEPRSHRIARCVVKERPIRTTLQLARIIEMAVGGRRSRIHPATKSFQALRIAVNSELKNLEDALRQTVSLLGSEGRLVVISYHSLEDRIVKQFIRREIRDCICPPGMPQCVCGHTASLRAINKKVIKPSPEEVRLNPRSRSARLRVAERLSVREENQFDRFGE